MFAAPPTEKFPPMTRLIRRSKGKPCPWVSRLFPNRNVVMHGSIRACRRSDRMQSAVILRWDRLLRAPACSVCGCVCPHSFLWSRSFPRGVRDIGTQKRMGRCALCRVIGDLQNEYEIRFDAAGPAIPLHKRTAHRSGAGRPVRRPWRRLRLSRPPPESHVSRPRRRLQQK